MSEEDITAELYFQAAFAANKSSLD